VLANPPFSQNLNCNVRRHVDNAPPPKPHDVRSHLHGGVPRSELDALERFWTKTKKDCVRGERMPTKVAAALSDFPQLLPENCTEFVKSWAIYRLARWHRLCSMGMSAGSARHGRMRRAGLVAQVR